MFQCWTFWIFLLCVCLWRLNWKSAKEPLCKSWQQNPKILCSVCFCFFIFVFILILFCLVVFLCRKKLRLMERKIRNTHREKKKAPKSLKRRKEEENDGRIFGSSLMLLLIHLFGWKKKKTEIKKLPPLTTKITASIENVRGVCGSLHRMSRCKSTTSDVNDLNCNSSSDDAKHQVKHCKHSHYYDCCKHWGKKNICKI